MSIDYTYNRNDSISNITYGGGRTLDFNYDSQKQLLQSIIQRNPDHRIDYIYDSDGQRCKSDVSDYRWNSDGTLAEIKRGSDASTYGYDVKGNRWKAIRNGAYTWYLDDMQNEWQPGKGGVLYKRHIKLPGGIICTRGDFWKDNVTPICSFSDGLSHVATWNVHGMLLEKSEYFPYGEKRVVAGTEQRRFTYSGKEKEPDFADGLLFYGTRYYDPYVKSFVSADPTRIKGSTDSLMLNTLQPYVYAASNPTTYRDIDGLAPELNALISGQVGGGDDISQGSNFTSENNFVRGALYILNTANNFSAFILNSGLGSINRALNTVSNLTGIERGAIDFVGLMATGGSIGLPVALRYGLSRLSTIARGFQNTDRVGSYSTRASSAVNRVKLNRQLTSQHQMSEKGTIIAGPGAKKPFRDAEKVSRVYGGNPEDWVKKSSSWSSEHQFETHWVENTKTGERVEFKTKFPKEEGYLPIVGVGPR